MKAPEKTKDKLNYMFQTHHKKKKNRFLHKLNKSASHVNETPASLRSFPPPSFLIFPEEHFLIRLAV